MSANRHPPRSMSSSPRPRPGSASARMGTPPPLPDGADRESYQRILHDYQAKADAITTENEVRRAALNSERMELSRQYQLLQQALDETQTRMAVAKDKGKLFKGSSTGELAELAVEVAKMENRAGFLDGKLSFVDDLLLKTNTELKSNIDRLERERANEIRQLADDGLESAM